MILTLSFKMILLFVDLIAVWLCGWQCWLLDPARWFRLTLHWYIVIIILAALLFSIVRQLHIYWIITMGFGTCQCSTYSTTSALILWRTVTFPIILTPTSHWNCSTILKDQINSPQTRTGRVEKYFQDLFFGWKSICFQCGKPASPPLPLHLCFWTPCRQSSFFFFFCTNLQ